MKILAIKCKGLILLLSVIFSLLISFSSHANQSIPAKIKIGSYPTPGLIQEDGKGLFNYLNRQIFSVVDLPVNLSIKPINRTKQEFADGKVQAYFPELWENLPKSKEEYAVSDPIFYKKVILFTRKQSSLKTLNDFENKILGLVTGYAYGKAITNDPNLNLSYQNSDDTNIRLLANNRIDGTLGGFPATVMAVEKSKYKHLIHYDLEKPVAILESFYVCPNTQQGKDLCLHISEGIQKLKKIGALITNPVNGHSKFDPMILN